MRKIPGISLMIFFSITAFSQQNGWQKEINEQVWKPFISAFNNRDDDAFSAVHSKEVFRVSQDDNRIFGYNEYFKEIPDSEKARWKDWKRNIELRFLQRIASGDKAFEVGYYKSSNTNTVTGEKRTAYGKFHVLLRKENGTWKILMDADANEKTDEAIFMTASPME